jgi:hypothetical protein
MCLRLMCQRLLIGLVVLLVAHPMLAAQADGTSYAKWHIEDRFENGIPSWQSYPLSQDIGYDPSLYTSKVATQTVLRRDVISEGQEVQEVGLIRSLSFRLTGSTRIEFSYSITLSGQPVSAKIILASRSGARYEASLPIVATVQNRAVVDGNHFHVPAGCADIEAVVISVAVRAPPVGSHSVLTLNSFSIEAMRPATLTMLSPQILSSSTGNPPVVGELVKIGSPAQFSFTSAPKRAVLEDGSGNPTSETVAIQGKQVCWTPTKSSSPGLWTMKVSDDRGSLAFRIMVLGDQPRGSGILLSPERLEQLRTEDRFFALRETIHVEASKRAKELSFNLGAGDNIALLPSESVFAGLPAYADLMEKYGGAIAYNALDYRLNGNRQALETVREALLTVSAWRTWTPPWFTAHGIHTYYVVGVFTENLALGYDLVSETLGDKDRKIIEEATVRNSIQPAVDDYYLNQRMPTGASNHMAHSVGGALAAWAAFDRTDPSWRLQHGASLGELIVAYEDLLRGLFPGDGSEAEPAGYEVFAMAGVTFGTSSLASLGITPKGYQGMMDSFWWLRYAEVSRKLALDTGDTISSLPTLYGYAWLVEHSSDPGARWFYDTVERPLFDVSHHKNGKVQVPLDLLELKEPPNVLDLVCCTKAAVGFSTPVSSRIFDGRGSVVLRSGWLDPQIATSIRVGPWFNHEHHDQGSFQVAVHGQLLVGEGGYADYYKDPNYKTYFSEAPAHNVVLIDHDAFSQAPYGGRYWKALSNYPKVTSSFLSDSIDYVEADLEPAYSLTLKSYKRHFLFVKPGLLIVGDELNAPTDHVFDWLVHVAPSAIVQKEQSQMVISDPTTHDSLTLMASDPQLAWHLSNTPIAVNDFVNLDDKQVSERHLLSLESQGKAKQSFLVGLSSADAKQQNKLERLVTKSGQGFLRSDPGQQSVALFRIGIGRLEASGASTDGDVLAIVRSNLPHTVHLFTAHAHSLTINEIQDVSLSSPATLAWNQDGQSVILSVELAQPSRLRVKVFLQNGSLRIDDHSQPGYSSGNSIELSPGRHQVEFLLNAKESLLFQKSPRPTDRAEVAPAPGKALEP